VVKLFAVIASKIYLKWPLLTESSKFKFSKIFTFVGSGFKDDQVEKLYKIKSTEAGSECSDPVTTDSSGSEQQTSTSKYLILGRIQKFIFCRRFIIGLLSEALHLLYMLYTLHQIGPDGKLSFQQEQKYLPLDGLMFDLFVRNYSEMLLNRET